MTGTFNNNNVDNSVSFISQSNGIFYYKNISSPVDKGLKGVKKK